jgi:hypothetical protein
MVLAVLAGAAPAAAQEGPHYTFVWNLNLQNLHPDLDRVRARCAVCTNPTCGGAGSLVGGNFEDIEVGGATSIAQQVTLPVTVSDLVVGTHWACRLDMFDAAGGVTEPGPDAPIYARAKDGTALQTEFGGALEQ